MENLRLLIVDDIEDNRLVLNAICRKMEGFDIKEAVDGVDAITVCETWHPHIILMDVMMPVLDGLETTRRIRQLPQFRKLPILALTAKAMKGDREKCIEAGANDYLSKPIDPERLFSMLRVWLSRE